MILEIVKPEEILAKKALAELSPKIENRKTIYDYIQRLTNVEYSDKVFLEGCYQKYIAIYSDRYLKDL